MERKDNQGRILKTGEYQREDGRYQFSKMMHGKRYTLYDKNLNLLREKELTLLSQLSLKENKINNIGYTVDSYTEYWFETYGWQGRKPTTVQLYKNSYNHHLKDKIGSICLSNLRRYHLQSAFNQLVNQGLKSSTLEVTKYCINNIFNMAVDEGLIDRNPARGLVLPKEQKRCREALEKEDLNNFFDFIQEDNFYSFYVPFFKVLFFTGMRVGECCALTWDDIDLKNRVIHITKNQLRFHHTIYIGSPKSKASFRTIPMNDIVYECLCGFYKNREKKENCVSLPILSDTGRECGFVSGFLFFSTRNKVLTESTVRQVINHVIKKMNKKNGKTTVKEFVPHQSRHTFTSLAYEAGIDVKYTSLILGHSNINITMDQYTHLSEKFNQTQREKFCRLGL